MGAVKSWRFNPARCAADSRAGDGPDPGQLQLRGSLKRRRRGVKSIHRVRRGVHAAHGTFASVPPERVTP